MKSLCYKQYNKQRVHLQKSSSYSYNENTILIDIPLSAQ